MRKWAGPAERGKPGRGAGRAELGVLPGRVGRSGGSGARDGVRDSLGAKEMEFSSRDRQKHCRLAGDRREQYPHSLQFYLEPPTETISLVEFESFAVDRLKRE